MFCLTSGGCLRIRIPPNRCKIQEDYIFLTQAPVCFSVCKTFLRRKVFLGLILESRVDMGCDTDFAMYYSLCNPKEKEDKLRFMFIRWLVA